MASLDHPNAQELHAQVQHRLIEQLSATEQRLRNLLQEMPEVVLQCDAEGRVTYLNEAWQRTLGRAVEDSRGMTLDEFVLPEDRGSLPAAPEEGQPDAEATLRFLAVDGSHRWLRVNLHAKSEAGHTGLIQDVTERKELELQLRQSQKLEAIGQLAGGIAHDFNNMLSVIIGASENLLTILAPEDADAREDAASILDTAEKAAQMTRQLLAFSRRQVMRFETVRLNEILNEMQDLLRRLMGPKIELRFDQMHADAHVRTDPSQMQQVLLNLAVNARDAMPDGGTLSISMEHLEPGSVRPHCDLGDGCYVTLVVADTGLGIAPEHLPNVFDPFFTTKQEGKGTGLGLATTYGIVRQSGGQIEVQSTVGEGTTIRIYLPCAEEPRPTNDDASPNPESDGQGTILLVDDVDTLRMLTARMLLSAGYRVLQASGLTEAIATYEQHADEIDMVLSDVKMPGGDGTEVVAELRRRRPDLKAMLMSGVGDPQDEATRDADFIHKPFRKNELTACVRQLLDR
jgi:two-component system cell cycle sensor histidine kinase/response regulator CckA